MHLTYKISFLFLCFPLTLGKIEKDSNSANEALQTIKTFVNLMIENPDYTEFDKKELEGCFESMLEGIKITENLEPALAVKMMDRILYVAKIIGDINCMDLVKGAVCFKDLWELRDSFCETQEGNGFVRKLFYGTCFCCNVSSANNALEWDKNEISQKQDDDPLKEIETLLITFAELVIYHDWTVEEKIQLLPVPLLIFAAFFSAVVADETSKDKLTKRIFWLADAEIGRVVCTEKPGHYCFINRPENRDAFCELQELQNYSSFSVLFGICYCCQKAEHEIRNELEYIPMNQVLGDEIILDEKCGRLELQLFNNQSQTIWNITTDGNFTAKKFNAIKTITLTREVSVVMESNLDCIISICGIKTPNDTNKGEFLCHTFQGPEGGNYNAEADFEMTSISCGCKENVEHILESKGCEPLPQSEGDECAILYEESDCGTLYHKPIHLSKYSDMGDVFETVYAHVIHSLRVQEDCSVSVNEGLLKESRNNPELNKTTDSTGINPTPLSSFSCSCIEKTSKLLVILLSVGLSLMAVFTTSLAVWLSRRKKRVTFTEEDTEILKKELFGNPDSAIDSKDDVLPFDVKYTIQKRSIERSADILGRGNFGLVYKGQYCPPNGKSKEVAIKTVDETSAKISDLVALVNEIRIMSHIGYHPNIISFIGAYYNFHPTKWEIYSVMELCGNSLLNHLQAIRSKLNEYFLHPCSRRLLAAGYVGIDIESSEHKIPIFDRTQKFIDFSAQIAKGMEYLSKRSICHVDLACRNVLLTPDYSTVKICDFGLSKKLYQKCYYKKNLKNGKMLVPLKWSALESLRSNKFSSHSDVWSYGITIWEIFTVGNEPYADTLGLTELLEFLIQGHRLPKPSHATEQIYKMMKSCWNEKPEARPTFTEIAIFFGNFKLNADEMN